MQLNFTFDQSISSLPTGFVTAVQWVESYFESLFTNNVTIEIQVGFGTLGGAPMTTGLGASQTNYGAANYNSVRSALLAENAPGSSTLPATSPAPGSLYVATAEAEALGLYSVTGLNGYVGFNSNINWSYTPDVTPAAGQYYFIGTLEHEITEVMGRISLVNYQPNFYTVSDLYRYTASGTRSLATGGSGSLAYFSVDGGTTLLRSWNNNPSNGDLGDWYGSGAPGADMGNDYGSSGVIMPFSAVDLLQMEALGWTTATGPAAPTIASFTPDSGVANDHITNATALTLSGTAVANSTVNVYDGATLLGTATANASGAWSYTTGTLNAGAHSFTATDTVSGATSAASAALSVTIDTSAPVAPSISSFSTDSGTVGDNITNDNTLTLTGTAEANSTVKVYDGATLLGTTTANGSGAWSYTTAALNNGAHTLTSTATDAAGNTSAASGALNVTIDTTAPVAPAISSFSTDSGTVGDNITSDNTLALTGTAEANSTVKIYDGATLLGSATASAGGAWTYTTAALGNGTHNLTATATDAAGNVGVASSQLNVTVDTTAPTVSQVTATPPTGVAYPGDTITLTLQVSESVSVTGTPTLSLNDGGTATYTGGSGTGTLTFSYTVSASDATVSGLAITAVNLPNGATVNDAAGNTANLSGALATFPNLMIDPPGVPAIVSFSPDTGVIGDGITGSNTLTLSGTATASSTVNVYDGATLLGTAPVNAGGAWSFATAPLTNGAHSFTVTDTVSGVTSAPSIALNVTVDTVATVAPTITSFSTDSGTIGDHITNDNTLTLSGTAEANSTVKVYDGATLLGTATANGAGAWTYTTAALNNGAHNLTATATDAAGNTGAASSAMSVTVDTVAPNAPSIASFSNDSGTVGDGITNDSTLTLTGTAEANSTIKVYDGATLLGSAVTNGTGAWSYTTAALNNGAHSLTATATDAAGNTGVASSALAVTIDTAAPTAPTITSFSNDSGTIGDNITDDNTLTLTGTAEANSTVKVYDGATLLGSATANGSGAWTYTTAALNDGVHNVTATATDAAGNISAGSTALVVTIDTVAPPAPTISFATDSGIVGDNITNDNTVTLTGTAEPSSIVTVYDGSTALGMTIAGADGTWIFNPSAQSSCCGFCASWALAQDGIQSVEFQPTVNFNMTPATDGVHQYTATATDPAGHTSAPSTPLIVTIDTVVPVAPTISSFSTDSGTVGDGITNDNTLTLSGSAEANSTVKVYDGATLLGSATANGSGAWSYTTAALNNGAHSLTATATDVAGNTGAASAALSVTIDTTAPAAPAITLFSTDSGTVGDNITNDNTLTLTGTAEANSTVKVYDGATLLGSVTANGAGAWNYTTAALNAGAHSVTAAATDAAGNTGATSAALSVTIDTTAPVAPTIASFSTDSGTVGDGLTNDNTLTLTGTAEANSTVKVYDSATLLGSATANGSGAWTYTTAALNNGAHSLTATATDAAGNTGAASSALNVTVDTAAPVAPTITSFSTDSGSVGDGITNDNTLTLTGTAEANSTVKVYDGATLLGSVTANGTGAWAYTTAALNNGAHSLTATATDAAGNTGAASSTLNVTIDTTAPVAPTITSFSTDSGTVGDGITNDNTLTLTGTAEANSTVKVYDGSTLLGTTTANSSGAWSYTTTALTDGLQVLTATATDAAGNVTTASGPLGIIIDTSVPVAPAITSFSTDSGTAGDGLTNDNTLTLTGSAEANSTVKVYDGATLLGTAAANGAGAWSYTTAALNNGAHSLTATATDAAGNVSAASAALSVTIDTAAPVVPTITSFSTDSGTVGDGLTNDNTLTLTGSAEANATVKVYDGANLLNTITANGTGAWSYTTAALSNGAHSLTATATDAAGNVSTASAALSVTIDTAAPVAPTITSFSTDSGTAGDGLTNDNTLTLTGTAEANSTVKVYDGATLLGSVTANSTGAWAYTTAALNNGAHSLTANATDAAGNVSAASAALNVTIDTAAPTVTQTTASPSTGTENPGDTVTLMLNLSEAATVTGTPTLTLNTGGTATYSGGSGTNILTFTYTVATNDTTVSALAITGINLPNGAAVNDVAGNAANLAGALISFPGLAIDPPTNAPNAPTITSFSTDSGKKGDGITNDNTLTLSGTAEANSTVKIYDGATLLNSVTANGAGAWSYTTPALADGLQVFTATATNAAGSISAASTAIGIFIDSTAPKAPHITTETKVDTSAMLNGTAEANSTVKIYDGSTFLGSVVTNGSGTWAFTSDPLPTGLHNFTAAATDAADNTSPVSQIADPTTGAPVVIESNGTTSLVGIDSHFCLYDSNGSGPSLKYLGADVTAGQFGAWTPIAAEQTATGYVVAWKMTGSDLYTVWSTDAQGGRITNLIGAVSGSNAALKNLESSFHQDLNGDGTLVIESIDPTSLVKVGNNFYLEDSSGVGPSIKYLGASITDGQFGTWTPIGAHQTATGYEVAWKMTDSDQYTVWSTDAQGNRIANLVGAVTGSSSSLQSFEASFLQDLNNDGHIGSSLVVNGSPGGGTLTSTAANEVLFGSSGNDTFVFSGTTWGTDTVANFHPDTDVIQVSQAAFTNLADVLSHAAQVGTDVVISVDPADSVTLKNTVLSQITTNNMHIV